MLERFHTTTILIALVTTSGLIALQADKLHYVSQKCARSIAFRECRTTPGHNPQQRDTGITRVSNKKPDLSTERNWNNGSLLRSTNLSLIAKSPNEENHNYVCFRSRIQR